MTNSYTSELATALAPDLLSRFKRYVRIDTQSTRERTQSPSTPGQLDLARLLVQELTAAGVDGAELDHNGYVTATLPGNAGNGHAIGLIAHMDTSPDAPGAGVQPIVHAGYDGGAIELPLAGTRLDPVAMPELTAKRGHDIVTASGDTLLGADDKAGVAEIMAAVAHLAAHPELPRPTLKIAFTPDEEMFAAIEVIASIRGVDVHPGYATGKLVSALRLAAQIVAELPSDRLTPDTTSGRDGFIHPYELTGTAAEAKIRAIVRDFDEPRLSEHVGLFERTARRVVDGAPGATLDLDVRRQYRNMREYLAAVPYVVDAAEAAISAEGLDPVRTLIRGGTDGSRLSEMGLPTPNIFTGGHEFHSVREWASLQDMAAAAATIVRLAEVWTRPQSSQRS
jgi:tripeptide aminopeptidase